MNSINLKDKVAIVTGAASGLGRSTANQLAGAGARLALVDVDREKLEEVVASIRESGAEVRSYVVDIADCAKVKATVSDIAAAWGQIDILINNAGAGWQKALPFKDLKEADWEWILDLNVKGTLYFTHAVIDGMVSRNYGKIINIGSIAATSGIPKVAVYSASKGAVVAFTKALAMELGPYNINVNCVSPGLVTTEKVAPKTDGNFLGRWGTADEMASLIVYLASDGASFITGVDYLIDGGRTLGPRGA
ncbi:SDR family oxidoreductase [Ruficoccus amylovorans]|uniref:SDR family oxidoreductase n=1 Tax=Ruficoccus amylovorans TaxID=1804625 RepID=A0A842HL59_9BACT|nr:SDR family NAD(P)-dependent oxidoreductase [Ruficoccus amylovorans]MBC2595871.1 SDR family oxidoreductase [Ruficoccus amylovorans]